MLACLPSVKFALTSQYNYCITMSSASFPSIFNFDFNTDVSQSLKMTTDDLPELLKHPCVMELYRQNQALQSSQIKLQESQSKFAEKSLALQERNISLQNQLVTLESELSASQLKVNTLSTELQSLQVIANL